MPPKRKIKQPSAAEPEGMKSAKQAKPAKKTASPKKPEKKSAKEESSSFKLDALITDSGWRQALQPEMEKTYFKELQDKLAGDYKSAKEIYPPQDLIFSALNLTPLDKVKAVILGQDPYHDEGQAVGLAFSVPKDAKVPGSLRNIFKELESDIAGFKSPDHGCLESWAKEGVLLLNATLTVEAHKPNSHKKYGWETFTDEVIQIVSREGKGVVFILWGNFAHKKEKLIDASKHVIIKGAHPSPANCGKFFNSKCFSKANDALKTAKMSPINWNIV